MVELFKALAEETRLRIFMQLLNGDMCVCEVENCLKISQSNASRHLTTLKKAGILDSYKKAQWAYYKISEEFIANNNELYQYLVNKASSMDFYAKDQENYQACKSIDVCGCQVK